MAPRLASTLTVPPGVPHQSKWQKRNTKPACGGKCVGVLLKMANGGVATITVAKN
jgi:hypothetical protein